MASQNSTVNLSGRGGAGVVKNADHVTLVVRDVEAAKKFFALLGFKNEIDTVISGEALSTYMGIKNIDA